MFALGAILAELFTLRPLFPGASEVSRTGSNLSCQSPRVLLHRVACGYLAPQAPQVIQGAMRLPECSTRGAACAGGRAVQDLRGAGLPHSRHLAGGAAAGAADGVHLPQLRAHPPAPARAQRGARGPGPHVAPVLLEPRSQADSCRGPAASILPGEAAWCRALASAVAASPGSNGVSPLLLGWLDRHEQCCPTCVLVTADCHASLHVFNASAASEIRRCFGPCKEVHSCQSGLSVAFGVQPLMVARAPLGVLNDKPVVPSTAQSSVSDAKDWKLTAQVHPQHRPMQQALRGCLHTLLQGACCL